jgi:hypothetical protein
MSFNLAEHLEFLDEDEYLKFGLEIVANAGCRGLSDAEADKALRRLHEWMALANFIRLWRDGQVSMVWRPDLDDLVVRGVKDPL